MKTILWSILILFVAYIAIRIIINKYKAKREERQRAEWREAVHSVVVEEQEFSAENILSTDWETVYYIGPDLTDETWNDIISRSRPRGFNVVHLKYLLQHLTHEIAQYNFPGMSAYSNISFEDFITHLKTVFPIDPDSGTRYFIRYNKETQKYNLHSFKGSTFNEIKLQAEAYFFHLGDHRSTGIRFRTAHWTKQDVAGRDADEQWDKVYHKELEENAQKAIKDLLLAGYSADALISWIKQEVKPSRIRITKKYQIILADYDIEIILRPLPKAVFLFFLKHKDGFLFKELQDHRDELLKIYEHVSVTDNKEKMKESIDVLTDPYSNSISEKCSAIKSAFLEKIADSVAKNYYIDGPQGKAKRILLDRSLVEWDAEI